MAVPLLICIPCPMLPLNKNWGQFVPVEHPQILGKSDYGSEYGETNPHGKDSKAGNNPDWDTLQGEPTWAWGLGAEWGWHHQDYFIFGEEIMQASTQGKGEPYKYFFSELVKPFLINCDGFS